MLLLLELVSRDFRFALRQLAAKPGWTMAAIVCLAIAAGANTAAFSLINGLALRPLPFEDADRLVMVALRESAQAGPRPFSLREYREVAERTAPTVELIARTYFPLSLATADGARMVQAELVSGNYFRALRVNPFLGVLFDADADRAGAVPAAVVSHRLWRERLHADPHVIGTTVRVNGRPYVIAGITPPSFVGATQLIAADLWLPAHVYADLAGSDTAETVPMFGVMGRMRAGNTPDEVQARLTVVTSALAPRHDSAPPTAIVRPATGFGAPPAIWGTVTTLSTLVYVMMALLMTIACANVAALVLARGVGRTREIAVRLAIGASRWHIVRQILAESLVLAVAGSLVGAVAATWLTQMLVAHLSTPFQYVTYAVDVHPDMRVFAWTVVGTAIAVILCGIAPVHHAGRVDVLDVLRQSVQSTSPRRVRRSLHVLVAVQFAVSTMLLVGAGMLLRAYVSAASVRPGFDAHTLMTATLDFEQTHANLSRSAATDEVLVEQMSSVPGVESAALTRDLPLAAGEATTVFADDESRAGVTASHTVVSPGYFQTLGLRFIEGRSFDAGELARRTVAVIDEVMARRLWPNEPALGRTFRVGRTDAESIEVVGVVSRAGKPANGEPPKPLFYQPIAHQQRARVTVVLRTHGEPAGIFNDVRAAARNLDENLAFVDLRTMDRAIRMSAEQRRLPAVTLGLVGLMGLVLSAVGLYGVLAYVVRARGRELGIRAALGASPRAVRRLVLAQGLRIVAVGLAIGMGLTFGFVRLVRALVANLATPDVAVVAAVCLVLLSVGTAALVAPARWASRLDPARILRSE